MKKNTRKKIITASLVAGGVFGAVKVATDIRKYKGEGYVTAKGKFFIPSVSWPLIMYKGVKRRITPAQAQKIMKMSAGRHPDEPW